MSIIIAEPQDLAGFEELQQRVWGCSAAEIVPAHLLQAHQHHGACLLGAWRQGRLVGFVYAFPGPPGSDYLYSHLAAVAPEEQGRGSGRQLKEAQGEWARRRGYQRIVWTYDPLQAANARLNIGRLGATAKRYLINYYGELDDELNRGLPTDRLEVDWWLDGARTTDSGERISFPWPLDPKARVHWRQVTRGRFLEAFNKGLAVVGFDLQGSTASYRLGLLERSACP